MKELTLYFEYCDWIGTNLEEYLLSLDGITEININTNDAYIDIKYDSSKTTPQVIKYEILFCIGALKIPSITAFNKHEKAGETYTILIKDICCEFCFKGMIDDLFMILGINSAQSDFDYDNMFNVKIDITYDSKRMSKEEIITIEKKLNNYDVI